MLTYQYHMPKRIDLTQLGQAREFDFYYYYSFSENQNHLSIIYVGKKDIYAVYHFTKRFRKIWLENISNTTFWVVTAENFREQRNI